MLLILLRTFWPATLSWRRGLSGVQRLLQPVGDVGERSTGCEDLRHPGPFELGDVCVGDDPAGEDEHIAGSLGFEGVDDAGKQGHVGAREDGQTHSVGILLHDGCRDLLGRLVQPSVNDLESGFAQRPGDDPGPAVVTVEARLGYHHPVGALHRPRYSQVGARFGQPG